MKTVFLIALAFGRRRSETHALSATSDSVNFSADKSLVILHSFPGFLTKNQVPSVAGTPIEIPAPPSENSSDSLCVLFEIFVSTFVERKTLGAAEIGFSFPLSKDTPRKLVHLLFLDG